MHDRCYNPNTRTYATHGARGIKVCKRWFKFEHFYADMGPRPDGMTLERKNNDGNYTPSNCCWATPKQQGRNRRSNRILEYNGRKQIVADWAREYGMPPLRLWQRLNRGWSVEKALTTPSLRRQVVRLYSDAL